ncbi:hypothetical protein [Kitasatospora sp. NPDC085879]|uniref:hypothetical protein n=1 Tax=Kitasatospora sp. NPDC085879 TaxID=3154769 RepID=UPI003433BB49
MAACSSSAALAAGASPSSAADAATPHTARVRPITVCGLAERATSAYQRRAEAGRPASQW